MMPALPHSRVRLALECAALFIAMPALMRLLESRALLAASLWVAAILAYRWWRGRPKAEGAPVRVGVMAARFVLSGAVLGTMVWWLAPHMLFAFPQARPGSWAMVMLLYPLLSAWPQEMLYRAFFMERYRLLFPTPVYLGLASAVLFGLMHLIFDNWIAVGLSLIGGVFFSRTYMQTQSLKWVVLEHAFYGGLIFTIGLGQYFYASW